MGSVKKGAGLHICHASRRRGREVLLGPPERQEVLRSGDGWTPTGRIRLDSEETARSPTPPGGTASSCRTSPRASRLLLRPAPRRRPPPAIQAPDCPAVGRVTPRAPARCARAGWRALHELTHPARGVRAGRLVSARAFGGRPAGYSQNLAVGLGGILFALDFMYMMIHIVQ